MTFASTSLASRWMRKGWFFLLVLAMRSSIGIGLVADAFSAAPSTASSNTNTNNNNKDWLVVDFDGTCTVRDTIAMLPRLAALAQSRLLPGQNDLRKKIPTGSDGLSPDAAVDFQGRLSIFSMLEDEYFRQYTRVQKSIQEMTATTNSDGADNNNNNDDDGRGLEQLTVSLDKLDDVSTEITHEVSRWRVLGGLGGASHKNLLELIQLYKEHQDELEPGSGDVSDRNDKLHQLIDCLSLRKGCLSVLQKSSQSYGIGVLSINWCPALIESVLVHPLCSADESNENDGDDESTTTTTTQPLSLGDVPIWSNNLDEEGVVALPFPGAISKREKILELQRQQGCETPGRVVYIGDSSTDLLAILQADVGILLGGSKSAISLATKFGVSVRPLGDYDDDSVNNNNNNKNDAHIVWTANNWDEIGSFLER